MRSSFDVGAWRRHALASKSLTPAVKVLLVVMADAMKPDGTVSVPRKTLAQRCGCQERQITERLQVAVKARYLDSLYSGQRQRTAVYKGLRQSDLRVWQSGTQDAVQGVVSPVAEPTVEPHPEIEPLSVEPPFQGVAKPYPSSKHTGTAAGRATREPGTTELRNESGNAGQPSGHRAFGRGAA